MTNAIAEVETAEPALTSMEEERLKRIGIAVMTALVAHFALFLGIAVASWSVEIPPPSEQVVEVLKTPEMEEVRRPDPVVVEPPRDALPGIEDMTVPDEDKSSRDPGGEAFDPNMRIADHYETDDGADGHGARGDPNAKGFQDNTAMEIHGFSKSGIMTIHGSGTGTGTQERYGHRGPGGQANLTMRHGGNRSTQNAVRMCLIWLQKHQSPDGRWDADGFDGQCTSGRCGGKGTPHYDVGLTGLSIVAFLGHGDTHLGNGPFKEAVKKGLDFLRREQRADGCIGDERIESAMYNHALATYALAEAYMLTRDPSLKDPVEKAVKYLVDAQNPGKAWRYQNYNKTGKVEEEGGNNDTSVTGWVIMALHAAEEAGVPIPPKAYEGANAWLDEVMGQGYKERYDVTYGYYGRHRFVYDQPYVTTAAGVLTRQFTKTDRGIDGAITTLMKRLPTYGKGKTNFYEWYYSTLVIFQYGGEAWKKWNRALIPAICENLHHKETDACIWGSMDPDPCTWGRSGGRVYATACAALCMEVYYRYLRLDAKKR